MSSDSLCKCGHEKKYHGHKNLARGDSRCLHVDSHRNWRRRPCSCLNFEKAPKEQTSNDLEERSFEHE